MPQDRPGRFSTEPFECYQRSENALIETLAEMCVQGASAAVSSSARAAALLEPYVCSA